MDFYTYGKVNLNLSLMKIARYYKKKQSIVVMMRKLEPWKVTKCYVFKEYDDGNFPIELQQYDNIECIGRAFHPHNYVPLNEEVERCAPDSSVYEGRQLVFALNRYRIEFKMFNALLRAHHARMSLNGRSTWDGFEQQLRVGTKAQILMLHDYNLGDIEGARAVYDRLARKIHTVTKSPLYLGLKFPLVAERAGVLSQWIDVPLSMFFNAEYHGLMPDKELVAISQSKYGRSFLEKTEYNITKGANDVNALIQDIIPHVLKQCTFLCRRCQKIRLTYDRGILPPLYEHLLDTFNSFMSARYKGLDLEPEKETYFCFIKAVTSWDYRKENPYLVHLDPYYSPEHIRMIFRQVKKDNYELFRLMYEYNGEEFEKENEQWTKKKSESE